MVFMASRNTTMITEQWKKETVESEIVYKYFVTKIAVFGQNKIYRL